MSMIKAFFASVARFFSGPEHAMVRVPTVSSSQRQREEERSFGVAVATPTIVSQPAPKQPTPVALAKPVLAVKVPAVTIIRMPHGRKRGLAHILNANGRRISHKILEQLPRGEFKIQRAGHPRSRIVIRHLATA